jgi:hypothetical protein
MPDVLQIGTKIDLGPVQSGMPAMANIVKESTQKMSSDFTETTTRVETLKLEIGQLQAQLQELNGAEAASPFGKVQNEVTEARHAAHLLGEEIGVKIPRALQGVLANSQLLGPILANAFSVIAVAGFIEIAVKAGEKLSELISKTFIFTEAQKELEKQIVAENNELDNLTKAHTGALREQLLIGASAEQAAKIKLGWAQQDLDLAHEKAKADTEERVSLTQQIALLKQKKDLAASKQDLSGLQGPEAFNYDQAGQGVSEYENKIDELNKKLNEIPEAQLTIARQQAAFDAATTEAMKYGVAVSEATEKAKLKAEEEAVAITHAMTEIAAHNQQLVDERAQMASQQEEFGAAEEARLTEATTKELEKRINAEAKFRDERIHDAETSATAEIDAKQRATEELLQVGQISVQQEVAQLKDLAKQKLDIEHGYLDERIKEVTDRMVKDDGEAYEQDLAEYSKLLSAKTAADDKYTNDVIAAQRKQDEAIKQEHDKELAEQKQMLDRMTNALNQSLIQWINGQKTFTQAMAEMWQKLADQMIMQIMRAVEQQIIASALQKSLSKEDIVSKAHEAAADAYTWASTWGGPPAGAVAAALAFSSVAALSAFEQGGIVPETDVAMLHKNEMVLPAAISQKVQNFTEPKEKAGGDTHLHVSAVDGESAGKFLQKHSGTIRKQLQRMVKNGKGL